MLGRFALLVADTLSCDWGRTSPLTTDDRSDGDGMWSR
jgi:hypothetical protein